MQLLHFEKNTYEISNNAQVTMAIFLAESVTTKVQNSLSFRYFFILDYPNYLWDKFCFSGFAIR